MWTKVRMRATATTGSRIGSSEVAPPPHPRWKSRHKIQPGAGRPARGGRVEGAKVPSRCDGVVFNGRTGQNCRR